MSDTTIQSGLLPVIHPLDDVREEKLFRPELGRMRMTPGVRLSLLLLRSYVVAMLVLVACRAAAGL